MDAQTIMQNVQQIKEQLAGGNPFGERVQLVAAIKTQTPQDINVAIAAGVDAVAENKPQEFRDKNALVNDCPRHFIGHLQTNKIKYLIGKIELYHSCDRDDLAEELSKQSTKRNLISNVLLQVNIGAEYSKGGYALDSAKAAFERLRNMDGLCVKGFMAMLPEAGGEEYLRGLARRMRALFDWAKAQDSKVEYLSMGMSGDYMLCVQEGSNMIRVGSTIFGARNYQK